MKVTQKKKKKLQKWHTKKNHLRKKTRIFE
jgi:hypothetical protein